MSPEPWLWLVAGPNGAGKSTYARDNLSLLEVINPDDIARRISPREPERAALRAGRLALNRVHELLKARRSFGAETTLAGHWHLQTIRRAALEGWKVGLVYIGLRNPAIAISRVRWRHEHELGHNIAAADVRRRYKRTLENLPIACQLADEIVILDNSSTRHQMKRVLAIHRHEVIFRERKPPVWLRSALQAVLEPPRHE